MHVWKLHLLVALAAGLLPACTPELPRNAIDARFPDVSAIVDDEELTGEEKRAQLEALGLPSDAINNYLAEERTVNQFGGDLRSAYEAVSEGRYTDLTPDEVQIFGDGASATGGTLSFALEDDEAQSIVSLFRKFDIDNGDELSAFLDDPGTEVPAIIPEGALQDLFVDFDPDELLPDLP